MKRRRKRREIGRKELVERTGKQEVQEGIGKVGVCASFAVQSSTGKKRLVFLEQRFALVVQEREYTRVRGFHLVFSIGVI
jgi:hypothetical protein